VALIVEDGTGLAAANGYVSLVFFRSHHADRGRDAGSSNIADAQAEAAIVRATDYIDGRFGSVFRGAREEKEQGLEWPRIGAFDDDGFQLDDVPVQIQKACAEYALRAFILGELLPDAPRAAASQDIANPTAVVTGTAQASGVIKSTSDQVGPIKTAQAFMSQAEIIALLRDRRSMSDGLVSGVYLPEYPTADLWIRETVEPSGSRVVLRG